MMNTPKIIVTLTIGTIFLLPSDAQAASAPCAEPVKQSIAFDPTNREVTMESSWRASKVHRVTISIRAYVNGRLLIQDTFSDNVMPLYQHDANIAVTRKPRWASFVLTIQSEGCRRTTHMRKWLM